jgi:hypothetical protein
MVPARTWHDPGSHQSQTALCEQVQAQAQTQHSSDQYRSRCAEGVGQDQHVDHACLSTAQPGSAPAVHAPAAGANDASAHPPYSRGTNRSPAMRPNSGGRDTQGDTSAGLCTEQMKDEMPGWEHIVTHLQHKQHPTAWIGFGLAGGHLAGWSRPVQDFGPMPDAGGCGVCQWCAQKQASGCCSVNTRKGQCARSQAEEQ